MYYAHSPRHGVPAQSYAGHVLGTCQKALGYLREMGRYLSGGADMAPLLEEAAKFHDLGKLDKENQAVLSGRKKAGNLPKNHADAGVAHLLRREGLSGIAALLVFAHHAGLPYCLKEYERGKAALRDPELMEENNRLLPELERIHHALIPSTAPLECRLPQMDQAVLLRLLLACLVDADHSDTGIHYGKYPAEEKIPSLRPQERLARLNRHVAGLGKGEEERNSLRGQMYLACRDAGAERSISACDSPVGSGKTFAVMAHLLAQAEKRSLRRIFVVLPYTNIITQSVSEYRAALVLPGENPKEVVAELHHRADFQSRDSRHLTALWRAPIIVTTAVAFFETMASNAPSALRRLHELPGSAIFMDEAHAALPVHLLPLAWKWMNIFGREWGCYWVLASGSLTRFWQISEIAQDLEGIQVPEIVPDSLRQSLINYEKRRISYRYEPQAKNIQELIDWISPFPGPRLLIVNTIQSAAVLANALRNRFGRERVEHLSSALTPEDRAESLKRIAERLADKTDQDWTLVATSCVEAGVDFSFRTGFRELASLVSLLQAAGRNNREGIYPDAEIWSFRLAFDPLLTENPSLQDGVKILRGYFTRGQDISPALSTQSISEEIRRAGVKNKYIALLGHEQCLNFPAVKDNFKVIESDSGIAVVNPDIAAALRSGEINWQELQKKSVRIEGHKLERLGLSEILPGIYLWDLPYDKFLGYMAGIIKKG